MFDLNTASAREIARLPGVDRETAYDLALWQPYRDWEDVEKAPRWTLGLTETLKAAGATLWPNSEVPKPSKS